MEKSTNFFFFLLVWKNYLVIQYQAYYALYNKIKLISINMSDTVNRRTIKSLLLQKITFISLADIILFFLPYLYP